MLIGTYWDDKDPRRTHSSHSYQGGDRSTYFDRDTAENIIGMVAVSSVFGLAIYMGWLTFDEPLDTEQRLTQVSPKSDKEAKLPPLPPVRPATKPEPKSESSGEAKTSWFSKSSKPKPPEVKLPEHNARVIIIGDEHETPYSRPPLSKELWWYGDDDAPTTLEYKGLKDRKRDIRYESDGFYIDTAELDKFEHGAISYVRDNKVVKLDLENRVAHLENGSIKFDKCLVATGGSPKNIPELDKKELNESVMLYRNVDDYRRLDSVARSAKHVVVVGGGFLGSELAYSLQKRYGSKGLSVSQVFHEKGSVSQVLPQALSEYSAKQLESHGVKILARSHVTSAKKSKNGVELEIRGPSGTQTLNCDHVVVAVGIDPNVELAKASGLELDKENGGILVDAEMRARSNVWAAGDVCSYYDVTLGRRRVEHWEHAQITGRVAGENMTGGNRSYTHQSSFFSLLGANAHFSAVGRADATLPTVTVFAKPQNDNNEDEAVRGVVFYLDGKRVVGVLLYNVFGMGIDIARKIIADRQDHDDFSELAKLFDLHTPQKEDVASEDDKTE
ncbi:Pyridine nucleotide-disulfide oxidoreductase family protein [Aphelenchoides avenae]|nr:Pyridine nucleotide-disulfide oxidoreductase family protein [Aphelenchus avenae]